MQFYLFINKYNNRLFSQLCAESYYDKNIMSMYIRTNKSYANLTFLKAYNYKIDNYILHNHEKAS